ncbi:MAG TPA: hypothetical protein VFL14_12370 [Xanthomonadales bacterium]|nr:hypothetical protein [Xanthomonadales bacterium]
MSIRTILRVAVLASAIVAASGCSLFGKESSYEQAKSSRPLEVPPDLDLPSTTGALSIPESGSGSGEAVASEAAPSDAPAPEIVAGEESTMSLADSPAGAWRRVGLALERSEVGEITARDEATTTFTLEGVSRVAAKDDRGFFKKLFTSEKSESAQVTRVVRISPDGDGSRVTVEDENGQAVGDEFARRIISALKQRLG